MYIWGKMLRYTIITIELMRQKALSENKGYVIGRVEIGSNVWIGSDVLILPNIRIGDNVIIAAGAIVTKDIPDNVTYIQKRNSVEVPNGK